METGREINNIFTIAAKEFKDYIKSKRFILIGLLYAVMVLSIIGITLIMFDSYNDPGVLGTLEPSVVLGMMDVLNIILVLLAIIITADSVSVEKRDRTIYQLLSRPVERSSVILGKFVGCLGVVSLFFAVSSLLAYTIVVALTGMYPSAGDFLGVIEVILFMVVLFAVYVALGILVSTVTKSPMASILAGIVVWIALFFSNSIGNLIGYLNPAGGGMMVGDQFSQYPLYAKLLVWIDPISHDLVSTLLGNSVFPPDGMSAWGNVIFLVAYVVILLLISMGLFKRQDI
jgi:ABC-type transport system involved in multi-copper enzyme maturation permease subunit